jgi:hypothetical protein
MQCHVPFIAVGTLNTCTFTIIQPYECACPTRSNPPLKQNQVPYGKNTKHSSQRMCIHIINRMHPWMQGTMIENTRDGQCTTGSGMNLFPFSPRHYCRHDKSTTRKHESPTRHFSYIIYIIFYVMTQS